MNTLDLVLSNNHIGKSGTILKDEDGIRVTTLGLASARDTTVVGLVATVKGLTLGNDLSLGELDGSLGGGNREAGALLDNSGKAVGVGRGKRAGGSEAGTGSEKKTNDLHLYSIVVEVFRE